MDVTPPRFPIGSADEKLQAVRRILRSYAGAITVDSMITGASRKAGVVLPPMRIIEVERIVHELSPGIRAFCRPDEVPQLMLELAEVLE